MHTILLTCTTLQLAGFTLRHKTILLSESPVLVWNTEERGLWERSWYSYSGSSL